MIPEDMIHQHLDMLLTNSDPGDEMHHMHVLACPRTAVGPFGLPDEKQIQFDVYMIAAMGDNPADPVRAIGQVVTAAKDAHALRDELILFAALSMETFAVANMDELGRKLQQQGRLSEHPDAAEATAVYATCRDGRRWQSLRWLTGPKAGQVEDAILLVGRPTARENFGLIGPFMRGLVGLRE